MLVLACGVNDGDGLAVLEEGVGAIGANAADVPDDGVAVEEIAVVGAAAAVFTVKVPTGESTAL